jgi:predicted methyltransferase
MQIQMPPPQSSPGDRGRRLSSCIFAAVVLTQSAIADGIPEHISAAVADTSRPETDRQRDIDRRPAEIIAFAGLNPGDKVADFMPGKGYFTRIFCKAVGETGHVYAVAVPPVTPGTTAPAPVAETPAGSCTNVTASILRSRSYPAPELHSDSDDPGWVYQYYASRLPAESFYVPEPLDLIWTAENYHDLHNSRFGSPDMTYVDKALLSMLKPGGILIVEDHAAQAGSGTRDTEKLHRIDPEQVKKEAAIAGFEFVGESDVLRHADDPHTAKAHEMHDKTDRFLLKFRRPE